MARQERARESAVDHAAAGRAAASGILAELAGAQLGTSLGNRPTRRDSPG